MRDMTAPTGSDQLATRSTTDVGAYLSAAGDFLRQRPVEHSVLLSVATSHAAVSAAAAGVDDPVSSLWMWVERGGAVVAAAQHTPPHGAYLSTAPEEAVRLLATELRATRPDLPGVAGMRPGPEVFAAEWRHLGGGAAVVAMEQGMYVATSVRPPVDVPGGTRRATGADADALRRWTDAFFAEAGLIAGGQDPIGPRIAAGLLHVWEDGGRPVSMAAVTPAQTSVSRVGLVYTPPGFRGRGYASACVAALTARELERPGRACMLFTDLTNTTSNGVYAAIGYRRVGEGQELRFDVRR